MNLELGTRNSKFPFVLVNMAMTADGKIATTNRAVSSFGSARDHEHLLELRATADAVMVGARTVDLNAINLGPGPASFRRARLRHGLTEYNLRIIVSGSGSINPEAEVFKHRFTTLDDPLTDPSDTSSPSDEERDEVRGRAVTKSPIIVLTTQRASKSKLRRLRALADELKVCGKTEINFRVALPWLRAKWDVQRLLCEGGGELNDALFRAGLVDELHLTVCPKVVGGRNAPTIADGAGFSQLADAARLELRSAKRIGDEFFLIYSVKRNATPATRRPGN
jgi:2,5-diamino-6-(ribosylamino)-4(3H)-pyrimidinone 5'-phosphate reductase